ncbi:MAG: DUF1588 domain-containing protein [Verrucomicrobiales bacterium]|nr:DUF1588 domain-containing protein [Verrucomicrobiales bacterium]
MQRDKCKIRGLLVTVISLMISAHVQADEFDSFLKPFFSQNCTKCHGDKKVKGKVNLKEIQSLEQFMARPDLIKEMIEVVDAMDMLPEDEPALADADRTRLVSSLTNILKASTAGAKIETSYLRRLNRFQYNNAIKDLFGLNNNVFNIQEKLMTRHDNYILSEKVPDTVNVSCLSLRKEGGMKNVDSFPQDLRAEHGFDNQANQLTLSPLLLDSFLKLSVSILESPDFNEGSVSIWNEFFKTPDANKNPLDEIKKRLEPFMRKAFRGPIDKETLDRYANYGLKKINTGLSFTEAMKKTASAILSSPKFLFRYGHNNDQKDPYLIASNLSFFLWASGPDDKLLNLAEKGDLQKPDSMMQAVDYMFKSPKIERFLDTFPSQWMQLENALAATPDPGKARLFSIDKNNPASLQMVLEPLLLFDTVFVENRPVIELISPNFSYRSEFLKTWYESDLRPPNFDPSIIIEENRSKDIERKQLSDKINASQKDLEALINPIKNRLLKKRRQLAGTQKPIDLMPFAAWEFNGDLKDSVGSLDLKNHGKIKFDGGAAILQGGAYLQSKGLPMDLGAKTLEVWCKVHNIDMKGGGLMGIQGPGDFFDTIVLGERKNRHWISGSNGFARTLDFPGSFPEKNANERLHLVMVYKEDGTTALYRNGQPYGKPFKKGAAKFPKNQSSVIFGTRHLPGGGNRRLDVTLARARFYNRALSAEEIAASSSGLNLFVSEKQLMQILTDAQKDKRNSFNKIISESENALKKIPKNADPNKARQEIQRRYDDEIRKKLYSQTFQRVTTTDPRYGGIITNAAMLSMTSGPKRTHPVARGAWVLGVVFNDPPPPPPNDVPPLKEEENDKNLTIRETFAKHRENPDCAGCHSRIDPLGFALENFDITGRWRDKYDNGRDIDMSGKLVRKHDFKSIVEFKKSLSKENKRIAKAFIGHLLRFSLSRELSPSDSLVIDRILEETEKDNFKIQALIRAVILSERFLQS